MNNFFLLPAVAFILPIAGQELPYVFNGKDLSAWQVPDNNIWWHVESGVLKVRSDPQQSAQTLWTKQDYRNFVMTFEFRMGEGTVDTGIFLRHEREQIQIGMSGSMKRDMTGSPYISGKGYPVEANVREVLKLKGWNEMTIIAKGKNYTVFVNGKHVMSYDSEGAIKKGPIGIQLHGNRDMSCQYRNIRLAELN